MTLQYLQDLIHSIDELRTISGTFTLHGTLCRALGLIRQRETVSLVFLQYNAAYNELLETAQIFELNDGVQACATNRDMLRKEQYAAHFPDAFEGSHTLFIGDASYTINITETGALRMQDWESLVLIAAFLCDGWQPESFLQLSYENLFFSRLELTGSYSTLAEISNNAPLRVAVRPANTVHPVEKRFRFPSAADTAQGGLSGTRRVKQSIGIILSGSLFLTHGRNVNGCFRIRALRKSFFEELAKGRRI